MSPRRNFFIRSVAAFAGDFAVGFAMAAACIWVIEAAALGLFLSFLLWILAAIAALALSQHVVHPVVRTLLSDRKLDDAVDAVSAMAHELAHFAQGCGTPPWDFLRSRLRAYAP